MSIRLNCSISRLNISSLDSKLTDLRQGTPTNPFTVVRKHSQSSRQTHTEEWIRGGQLTKKYIEEIKRRALRNRAWFPALTRVERGLLDLTISWVHRVRSSRLACVLREIISKLLTVLNIGRVRVRTLLRGRDLALRISDRALQWGNGSARQCRSVVTFHSALGLGVLGAIASGSCE